MKRHLITITILSVVLLFPLSSSFATTLDGNGRATWSFTGCGSDTDTCADFTDICGEGANSDNNGCSSPSGCPAGSYSEILSAANYSGGAGGRGYRVHYGTGSGAMSDGFDFELNSGMTGRHLWARWYAKYPPTFTTGWLKQLWSLDTSGSLNSPHIDLANDSANFSVGGTSNYFNNIGLQAALGSSTWDGQWHCWEFYIYKDSTTGIFRFWFDDNLLINATNMNTSPNDVGGFNYLEAMVNTSGHVPATACSDVDYDDFIITVNPADPDLVTDTNGYLRIGTASGGVSDTSAPIIGTTSPTGAQTCLDAGGNTTRIQAPVTDATPPINCEYSTNSGFTFGTGTSMLPTDGGSGANFYADIFNACNASYTYYMKCQDSASGGPYTSSNATISYSIDAYAADSTNPTIGSVGPSGAQTCIYDPRDMTVYAYNVSDNVAVDYVKVSTINGFNPSTQGSSMTNEGSGTWSYTFSGANQLACGASYTYYVKVVDTSGNISAQSAISFSIAAQGTANLLLYEGFEDANFSTRGWFDGVPTSGIIDSGGQNGNCAKFTFATSNQTATNMQTIRHNFSDTSKIYMKVYVKPALDWVGSGQASHPHVFFFLSNEDTALSQYSALNHTYLTGYVEWGNETNGLTPKFILQDGKNINTGYGTPPIDISASTENRAISGCNGYLATQSSGDYSTCYQSAGVWQNGSVWLANTDLTRDQWNLIEVYMEFNSTPSSTATADGKGYMWLNSTLVAEYNNLVFRTGVYPSLAFDQIILSPYIGVGSPVNQTFYIDELYVYDNLARDPPNPPPDPGTWTTRGAAGNSTRRSSGTDLRWGAAE